MSNHFSVLGKIASGFPRTRFITDSAGLVSVTKIEMPDKLRAFTLTAVGVKMRFQVLQDDAIVDSIISLPNESNSDYAARIANLISQYN